MWTGLNTTATSTRSVSRNNVVVLRHQPEHAERYRQRPLIILTLPLRGRRDLNAVLRCVGKVGFDHKSGWATDTSYVSNVPVQYRFNNGAPNQITMAAFPYDWTTNVDHDMGIFAQDRWTIHRLTATYGVRLTGAPARPARRSLSARRG